MKHAIPRSALDHHIGFVGKTGSGKTGSTKSGLIEPALAAGERVAIIDPTGAWWGLRLAADGKTKGLPIYVFGGDHGDYPLLANQGELMAEAIGTSNTPVILDTTKLRTGERMRFFTDFADAILRVNQGPLRLVIDEAHLFAPQAGTRGAGAMPDMLHAANNLISLGRSRGLRVVLISQRPAKVHKDSLTQVETLVAMRLIAPQDRKAVKEWIADQADVDKGKDIISSLPSLKTGEAWVWSPEANFLDRVTFPKPKTYDSSKGQSTGNIAKRLSPIDLEKLQANFAKVKTEAEAKDPKALQIRVAELTAKLKKAESTKPAPVTPANRAELKADIAKRIDAAHVRGKVEGYGEAMKDIASIFRELAPTMAKLKPLVEAIEENGKLIDNWAARIKAKRDDLAKGAPDSRPADPISPPPRPRVIAAVRARAAPAPKANGEAALPGPQQRILNSLATWSNIGETAPSNAQVAWLAGYSPSSSSYKNPRSALNSAGLLTYPSDDLVSITAEGNAVVHPIELSGSLLDFVLSHLPGPEARILKSIADHHPSPIDNSTAAEGANYSSTSSSYKNPRSALRSKNLITYPANDQVRVADWLFSA